MTRPGPGFLLLATGLTVAALVPVWAVEFPPLQDYPYHLVRANLLARFDDPAAGFAGVFERSYFPSPYLLSDLLIASLAQLMPVTTAGKVALSLYLILFPWSVIYLLHAIRSEKAPLGLFGFLLVYNWHFHMGFLNYVSSLPPALAAIGFWWKHQRNMTWQRQLVLAGLVFLVYLSHLYSIGILLFILGILALRHRRRPRRMARLLLPLAPAVAFLLIALSRLAGAGSENGVLILLYGGLKRKILLALGSLPSFSLAYEGLLFAAGGVLGLALLFRGLRTERPGILAILPPALCLLFVLLPDHVGRLYYISNRVPLFVLCMTLPLLTLPRTEVAKRACVLVLSTLALAHFAGIQVRYRSIDRELAEYAAVLDRLPEGARVSFRVHRRSLPVGRISPAAFFGGYHYLRTGRSDLPDLDHFVGSLRSIRYRDRGEHRPLSIAGIATPEDLEEILRRKALVGVGGFLVTFGPRHRVSFEELSKRYGYRRIAGGAGAGIYAKVEPDVDRRSAYFSTGFEDAVGHVVVYQHAGAGPVEIEPGFEEVFRRGPARLYRRDDPAPSG